MKNKLKYKHGIFLIIGLIFLFFSCKSVRMTDFKNEDCSNYCKKGVIDINKVEDETTIVYGAQDRCCLRLKNSKVKYKNDTLYLIVTKYGSPCRCFCTYKLTYNIKGLKTDDYVIKIIKHKPIYYNIYRYIKEIPSKLVEIRFIS